MNCPRCNAQNDESRHSCWNCFAQLHQAEGVKLAKPPKEKRPKKGKVAAPPIPEPEPQAEVVEEVTAPIEEPADTPAFEPTPVMSEAEMVRDSVEAEAEAPEIPANDTFAFPTFEPEEEPATAPDFGVPQIEEQQAEETTLEPDASHPDQLQDWDQEQELGGPQVLDLSDTELIVPGLVDLDAAEDETPIEPEAAPVEKSPESTSSAPEVQPEEPAAEEEQPPDDTPPDEGDKKPRSPLFGLLVIALILLFGAWMLANSYPSPGSVAQNFVRAVDSVMAGDAERLSQVSSEASQPDVVRMEEVFRPFRNDRLQLQVFPVEIVSETVTNGNANVVVEVNIGIMGATQAQGPLSVFLVKEGSFPRKQWKTDLKATGEHWRKELPGLISAGPDS